MKLKLGTNDVFDRPEGQSRATLERVGEPKKKINKPCPTQVRLSFRVKAPTGREYLVARTFCADLSYGTELNSFVESWLDGKFDPLLDENRELDLNLLIGREADLLITHYENGTYDKPFVKLAGIFPPGTLIH